MVPSIVQVMISILSGEWNGGLSALDMFNSGKLEGVGVCFLCHFRQTHPNSAWLSGPRVSRWRLPAIEHPAEQSLVAGWHGGIVVKPALLLKWSCGCWCCKAREDRKTKLEESRACLSTLECRLRTRWSFYPSISIYTSSSVFRLNMVDPALFRYLSATS
jgi:hypothetical protein